jgi:hypothetical protein
MFLLWLDDKRQSDQDAVPDAVPWLDCHTVLGPLWFLLLQSISSREGPC